MICLNGSLLVPRPLISCHITFQEIRIHDCVDAFIVMYAIDDSSSYEAANLIMNALSPPMESAYSPRLGTKSGNNPLVSPALIYLVGNKTDLVRGRQVSTEGQLERGG